MVGPDSENDGVVTRCGVASSLQDTLEVDVSILKKTTISNRQQPQPVRRIPRATGPSLLVANAARDMGTRRR